jgi:non-ribosomal peptide synthetase component F
MSETEGQLRGVWTYLTELFDRATVERMTSHYETLLSGVVADPEARVNALEMYTEAERDEQTRARQRQKSSNLNKFKSVVPKAVVEKTADTPGAR